MIRNRTSLALGVGVVAVAATVALAGCASSAATSSNADGPQNTQALSTEFNDGWAKSATAADGMSAVFGTLVNASAEQSQLVSAKCGANAAMTQLHETYKDSTGAMAMREVPGGFTIPAGNSLVLQPGGNHIMLMGLTGPLTAGQQITCDLNFGDNSVLQITVPVKDFSGANESYNGSTATPSATAG